MVKSHRAFPPGRDNLKIPISSRAAAHSGLALYAPCRLKGRLARWVAWRAVDVLGPRVLPGSPIVWIPPMGDEIWMALTAQWRGYVGHFDGLAVHERIQVSRRGFAALLLADGQSVGFVKVRDGDSAPLENEFRALEAMCEYPPRLFEVPQPVALGSAEGWHYLLTTALRPDLHRMSDAPPLDGIVDEIKSGLASRPRPVSTPRHWEPMHGDLTPWNLRQRRDRTHFLIDWEDASWGPPEADQVYYRVIAKVVGSQVEEQVGSLEVRDYWLNRLADRSAPFGDVDELDAELAEALLSALWS